MFNHSRIGLELFKKNMISGIEKRLEKFVKYMNDKEATDLEGCNPRSRRQWLYEFKEWSDKEFTEECKHENERLKRRASGNT
jgi:hypothetical protein